MPNGLEIPKDWKTSVELAKEYGYADYATICSIARMYDIQYVDIKRKRYYDPDQFIQYVSLRKLREEVPDYRTEILSLPYSDFMVLADFHVPYYSQTLLERSTEVSKRLKIKTAVLDGDFFDMKAFFASNKDWKSHSKEEPRFSFEVHSGILLIDYLLSHYDNIVFLPGNHDYRILRWLRGEATFSQMTMMITQNERVIISNLAYCNIGDWRITHPASYSRITGRVAYALANKYNMNIIIGHGHFLGMSKFADAKHWCIDSGGMFDPYSTGYYMREDTTIDKWNPGFVAVKNNRPYLFEEDSDWEFWKK